MNARRALVIATMVAASVATAHESHQHAAGAGLLELPPEYLHVLLNPLPVYGIGIGILVLCAGLLARSRQVQLLALALVVLTSLSAWPVFHYGKDAYKHMRHISDEQGQEWLDEHMDRAERFIYVFYGSALLGVAGLACRTKFPKTATALAVATLILGVCAVAAGGWISRAGGQTRHPEFRAPPQMGGEQNN